MSHTTQCPVCATTFVVAPEILTMAGGWVRCGRCANIFEATSHHPSENATHLNSHANPETNELAQSLEPQAPEAAVHAYRTLDHWLTGCKLKRILDKVKRSVDAPPDNRFTTNVIIHGARKILAKAARKQIAHTQWWAWHKGLLGFFLGLLLALQMVVTFRAELSTHYPRLQPAIQTVCVYLGCTVQALQATDQLVIDNTNFDLIDTIEGVGRYQLAWELHNQAPYSVMVPAIEISLTDALDRPVIRKVLLPAQFVPPLATLEPDSKWRAEVRLTISRMPKDVAIVGYRLTAFYP